MPASQAALTIPAIILASKRILLRPGREAVDAVVRPSGLIRRVVRHLVLEHDCGAVLAVPDDLVALAVLDKKAVGGDVIPVHDQAVRGGVARPAHIGAMIGPENADRIVEGVDAGRQNQMFAASQCIINLVHVVSRLGDEEVGDRDLPWSYSTDPGDLPQSASLNASRQEPERRTEEGRDGICKRLQRTFERKK
jgi:hypothetical protein